ncbi:MAG: hypothetical protein AAFW46_17650, partial [Pseudomonadota bacterium]
KFSQGIPVQWTNLASGETSGWVLTSYEETFSKSLVTLKSDQNDERPPFTLKMLIKKIDDAISIENINQTTGQKAYAGYICEE